MVCELCSKIGTCAYVSVDAKLFKLFWNCFHSFWNPAVLVYRPSFCHVVLVLTYFICKTFTCPTALGHRGNEGSLACWHMSWVMIVSRIMFPTTNRRDYHYFTGSSDWSPSHCCRIHILSVPLKNSNFKWQVAVRSVSFLRNYDARFLMLTGI